MAHYVKASRNLLYLLALSLASSSPMEKIPNAELFTKLKELFEIDARGRSQIAYLQTRGILSKDESNRLYERKYQEPGIHTLFLLTTIHGLPSVKDWGLPACKMAGHLAYRYGNCNRHIQEKLLKTLAHEAIFHLELRPIVANLTDLVLMNNRQPQRYGTLHNSHGESYPVEDPSLVDILREYMGLKTSQK